MASNGAGATPGGNRLGSETSPYLLQHAENPVDWYPWSEAAFAAARERDVPIFLSVGYSTCYWCHVMERESFEDAATGARMSELFVCVKVDREERPDVDDLYMTATQLMTGRGGWPMSVFLEPRTLKPFYCGTYFPPEDRHGMPGFGRVLGGMSAAYRDQRDEVIEQADTLADAVEEQLASDRAPRALGPEQVTTAVTQLLRMFDATQGGFGSAPKFPQPAFLDLLLETHAGAGDDATRDVMARALRTTLDRMAIGGMYDQVGGGFHRYSVDATWTVPHFEKMLYDNAQLAWTYAHAARVFDDGCYREIVRQTLEYVLGEMRDASGGFYSAQDAEVDHREGLNYLWVEDELVGVLGEEDGRWAAEVFGVSRGPNFQDPHHASEPARSVLRLDARPEAVAARVGISPDAFGERVRAIRARLYEARAERKQPHLDDKILAAWNGMMIAGLAAGAELLHETGYLDAAEACVAFVERELWVDDRLMRSWRDGQTRTPGYLEDSASVLYGLAELARVQREMDRDAAATLAMAHRVIAQAERDFGDGAGGFFDTRADQGDLFARARTTYDGAVPSGLSQFALALSVLDALEPEGGHRARGLGVLRSLSGAVAEAPLSSAVATRSLYRWLARGVAPEALAFGPPMESEESAAEAGAASPVQVFASVERLELREGEPNEATLLMQIDDGYHVLAARPAVEGEEATAEGLVPLRVGVAGGAGVRAYADYPEGEAYGVEGVGRIRVLSGRVELRVALEREGEWSGRPMLTVRYQACSDSACLAPVTVELDIALDPVR
ncbi:MAG: DUF255 domain-containing protein [Planctomycetota bacterium]